MEYAEIMKHSTEFLVGRAFMQIGGIVLIIIVLGTVAWVACEIWISASNRFRNICKAESMIFEFRKYRKQFLEWMKIKDGDEL